MLTKRPEFKRDLLLIGLLVVIVGVVFGFYFALKEEGDIALVAYNNVELFQVELENGDFKAATEVFITDTMPAIKDGKLRVNDTSYLEIVEGKGVLIYQDENNKKDYYFVKGNLGYVKIYYNRITKKMKVEEETSPYNTCSKQGESNDIPIVCLPNFITISFTEIILDDVI